MASNADGNNLYTLICRRCKSIVLRNGNGAFIENKEVELPSLTVKKSEQANPDAHTYENYTEWWFVQDVMTFENVGVTNACNGKRYLCCADCEQGPIGIQIENGYYLALERLDNKTD